MAGPSYLIRHTINTALQPANDPACRPLPKEQAEASFRRLRSEAEGKLGKQPGQVHSVTTQGPHKLCIAVHSQVPGRRDLHEYEMIQIGESEVSDLLAQAAARIKQPDPENPKSPNRRTNVSAKQQEQMAQDDAERQNRKGGNGANGANGANEGQAKKATESKPCACGCGGTTKSRFSMGHDARYFGAIKRLAEGAITPDHPVVTPEILAGLQNKDFGHGVFAPRPEKLAVAWGKDGKVKFAPNADSK